MNGKHVCEYDSMKGNDPSQPITLHHWLVFILTETSLNRSMFNQLNGIHVFVTDQMINSVTCECYKTFTPLLSQQREYCASLQSVCIYGIKFLDACSTPGSTPPSNGSFLFGAPGVLSFNAKAPRRLVAVGMTPPFCMQAPYNIPVWI